SMNSNIETLAHLKDDRAEAVEFVIGEKARVVGVPIKDLTLKENLLIACINRNGQVIIPGGNDEMKAGDSVIIVTTIRGLTDIEDILR
ncbi:MAG: TrkA C-terminal domain-containing protein, partial [Lachnospiraceae bacterium]|nr:TrkA C-terminal domain-containing protein [Lachnospiraceae bacterium]